MYTRINRRNNCSGSAKWTNKEESIMVEDVDLTPETWGWKKCHLFAIWK